MSMPKIIYVDSYIPDFNIPPKLIAEEWEIKNGTKYIIEAKHKEEIEAQYNKLKDEHDKEIDLLDDAYRAEIEQAREETRKQCADALDVYLVKNGKWLTEKQREVILNSGKQDKGGKA